MTIVGNGATQSTLLKARFVIFSCQKYVKKGYIEMAKKIYYEPLKGCAWALHFPLLIRTHNKIFLSKNLQLEQISVKTRISLFENLANVILMLSLKRYY